jgi:hypothetical protein
LVLISNQIGREAPVLAIFLCALGVVGAIGAVGCLRVGLRMWRGEGPPLSRWLQSPLIDSSTRAGYDRGVLALSAISAGFAVITVIAGVFSPQPRPGSVVFWVDVPALAVVLVFTSILMSVIWFNRPRFIVPPHLRGELGAVAEWRRSRRAKRR